MLRKAIGILLLAMFLIPAAVLAEDAADPFTQYMQIIGNYAAVLTGEKELPEDDSFNFSLYMCTQYSEADPLECIGYTFLDLDSDGIPELILGETDVLEENGFLFDIWTIRDGKASLLLQGWERNRLYLAIDENGYALYQEGADSAFVSIYDYGAIRDGQVVWDSILISDSEASTVWTLNDKAVDESKALELIKSWNSQVLIPSLIPFSSLGVQ